MADEATVQSRLTVTKGNLRYTSPLATFRAAVTGTRGPSPGAIQVTEAGRSITFPELTRPGLCNIYNKSTTYAVHIGIRDPATNRFYPLFMYKPGESYPCRLSDLLGTEYVGTGTGTSAVENYLYAKAVGGPVELQIDAIDD